MLRFDRFTRAGGVAAAVVAAAFLALPALAQAPQSSGSPAAAKAAGTVAAASANSVPATGRKLTAGKRVVSPYARAASQRERAGQAPIGHAPSMVQAMGKPRKPHAGAAHK